MHRHHRIMLLVLPCALGASSAAWAQDTPVAIPNPGFEGRYATLPGPGPVTGAIAPGWQHNGGFGDTTAVYASDTTNPHSGQACQSITVSAVRSGTLQLLQGVTLKGGAIYTVGAWFRGKPGSFAGISIQGGGPGYQQLVTAPLLTSDSWQFVTAQGYVPEGSDGSVIVSVEKPGTICVDDITVASRPGTIQPHPVLGPVPDRFFGIHVLDFQIGRLRNRHFYDPFSLAGVTGDPIKGPVAHDWEDNSAWADVEVDYSGDPGLLPGGGQAQTVVVKAVRTGRQQLWQRVALRPGQNYVFTAAVRAAPGAHVEMLFQNTNAPYEAFVARALDGFDGQWHDYSITGPVGATGRIGLMFASDRPGRYSVGNVRLTTIDGKAAPSGISQPPAVFGTLRLWDSGTTWALLEPNRGRWQFGQLDRWMAVVKPGQEVILTLGQSPTWASSDPSRPSYYGSGASAAPVSLTDWANYIKIVAQRYKGKIKYYEVWNEPNDPTFYSGSVAELAALTQAAAAALKSVDPDARLITAPAYSSGYLDRYLATGSAQYADIIGYHVYATPPEEAARQLANVGLVLAKYNLAAKPLWDTEGGSGDQSTPIPVATTYMVRKYLTDLAFGASNFGWYGWAPVTPFAVGTVENNTRIQTDAAKAFVVARDWLAGASVAAATIDAAQNWTITLKFADGRRGIIVWNPVRTTTWTPPAAFVPVTVKTLAGTSAAIGAGPVSVTMSPVLLVAP